MKTITKCVVASFALLAALHVQAQSVSSDEPLGLLGKRYVEASASAIDSHLTASTGLVGSLGVNLPMQKDLDLGFSYSYSHFDGTLEPGVLGKHSRENTLLATSTGYMTAGFAKPFLSAGLGYEWSHADYRLLGTQAFGEEYNQAIWKLAAGAEVPVSRFVFTPSISYRDGFRSSRNRGFTYGLGVHTWLSKSVGVFASAAFFDPQHHSMYSPGSGVGRVIVYNPNNGGTESWTFSAGLRFRF